MLIEESHELSSGAVVHVPQAQQQGLGAGLEQASGQPHQLIACSHRGQASAATTERDQFDRKFELIEIVEADIGICHTNAGKQRVVLAEESVRGNVNHASGSSELA